MKKLLLLLVTLSFFSSYSQLSEGFEGTSTPNYTTDDWALGSGTWKVFDNGIGLTRNWQAWTVASQVYAGTRAATILNEDVPDGTFAEDWLVTPQVTVPTDGQLRFFTRKAFGGNFGSQYTVRISTTSQTNAATFTTVQTWDDSNINSNQTAPFYEQKVINLNAFAGQNIFIAFVMTNDNGNRWLIDNVFVDQRCQSSTIQSVSSVNDTSVDLNWNNPSGASQWQIEWGPTGFTQGTGTLITPVTSNPYNLTGLTAATTYDFYVRSICPNENFSNWTGPFTFTTALCAVADQCDFDFIMTDSFGDGWNGARMQVVQFGVVVATIGATFTAGAGPVTVTVPLCSNQPFQLNWTTAGTFANEVGVSIVDPLNATIFTLPFNSGSQAGTTIFNGIAACTPPTCPQPSNIIVSGVNTTSGTVTWSDNTSGSATQWNVIIQPAGSGYPPSGAAIINQVVSSTSFNFSGLNSNTAYEIYISAICDPTGTPDPSFYTGPVNFTTTRDYCAGDLFTDTGGTAANYANNQDVTWTICPDTPGEAVTVFFTAFNTEANWDGLYVFDGPSIASPQIASANGAGNVPGGVPGSFWGTTIPGPFVSTHPSGCLTFRFRSDGSVTRPGWVANVICGAPPTCSTPSTLNVTNITSTSATLSWVDTNTPAASNWQVVVQPVGTGYPNASSTIINASTNPFTVTGLNPNTSYEFYVRSDCGAADGFSFWGGPRPFNTLFPGCGGSAPASDVCTNATPVCNLDGYCGNTSGTYTDASWAALDTAFCGSIENNSFLTFQATSTSISMNVLVGNCTNGSGIQFFMFSASSCGSAVTGINCFSPMNPGTNSLTFTGLTPGQTYYLMVDGFAGAVCDYSVTVTSGGSLTTDVQITQSNQSICMGESVNIDVTGGNGIYNWSPATGLNTTTGSSVIFTPTAPGVYTINVQSTDTNSLCATADFIEITVNAVTDPVFSNPGPICAGAPNVPLSNTDANGVTGIWTLSGTPVTDVDASTPGIYNYIFTPDPTLHPCVNPLTMQVEIKAACTFGAFSAAVFMDNCTTTNPGEFFNVSGSGADLIGPATNIYTNNDFGIYTQNSGNLLLKGAELKSFKTASSNVCSVNMYYRVYESSSTPGTFNIINLPFFDDCSGGTFPTGGPCNTGDQKWQTIAQNIDLTQNVPGNYIIEVYYEVVGDNDSPTTCDGDIELLNNNGNNYLASFTIQGNLTFSNTNEECGSSNASITISGFIPGSFYDVSYNDDMALVGPTNYQANANGEIIITGLNAGTYDNFIFTINGCSTSLSNIINITNFSPSITSVTNNSPICFGNNATFTIVGTPNYNVNYTINLGPVQTVTLDATGTAQITIPNPAVGSVNLMLNSIFNAACNITVTNSSSVVVNPLPTATISANSSFVCTGSNAVFTITGTPDAIVTYTINGGSNQSLILDSTGNFTLSIPSSVDVQVALIDISNPSTGCTNSLVGQTANVAIVTVPEATVDITQPTCAIQTGTVEVTSPLISQLNFPGNLFISEITDAQPGALTYVEIYNGTGNPVDLSAYKLRVTTNGTTLSCDLPLSGILANDDVVVIKLSSSANEGGVIPDLSFTTCTGVNNNDRIALSTASNVDIDVWGTPDGSVFTPANGVGYNYRRIVSGTTLPSTTWDPLDWNAIDWGNPTSTAGDYSDVGFYTIFASNYEYILNDGTSDTIQTTTTFSSLVPGNYTLIVHDTATNCYSNPISITIDPVVFANPVTTINYSSPVCENNANILPDTSASGFTSGGTYSSTAGLIIDPTTGEINVQASVPGTYTITYSVGIDNTNCINAGSSTFTFVITPGPAATFNSITLCEGDVLNTNLPLTSLEGFTGSWNATTIDTSVPGNYTYTFTPDSGQCASNGTLNVTITPKILVTFESIDACSGSNISFPTTSFEGYTLTGTWTPATISNTQNGVYTFTPDDVCYGNGTLTVTVRGCTIPKGFSPNGDGNNDTWNLAAFNVKKVEVFNRYGKKVYSKVNYVDEWGGKSDNGDELPTGTYYFMIEFQDRPTETGWVYINRGE